MPKFMTSRSLPSTANTSAEADKFIKSAAVVTQPSHEPDYPWQDPSISDNDTVPVYVRIPKKLHLKFKYMAKCTRLSNRVIFEEALEEHINAYFRKNNIPED